MTRLSLDAIKIISTIKSTGSFSMAAEALHKRLRRSLIGFPILKANSA